MYTEPNSPVNDETRRAIEALSTEYSWLVDHGHADRAAELFTDDAVLSTGAHEAVGIVDIRRHLGERAQNRDIRSRHVVTNIRLLDEGPEQVRGTLVMTIYRSIGESPRPHMIIGDVDDLYRRGTDGRWRLAERKLTPTFLIGDL